MTIAPPSTTPSPTAPRLRRGDLVLAVLILALAAGGYLLAKRLIAHRDITLPLSSCDLNQQVCQLDLPGGGALDFSIEPRPAPSLKPLTMTVNINGRSVYGVSVDIAGAEMQMGHSQPRLNDLGNGRFSGPATLPVCTTRRMWWQATLLIDSGSGVIAAPFRFATGGLP